jgi:hypothetical protein
VALDSSAAAIEREIDYACRQQPLLACRYSDAVFHLLTALDLEGAVEARHLTITERSIRLGHSISAMKYAMRWLAEYAPPADSPFSTFSTQSLSHASSALRVAESFLMINAAYSWAHRDVIDLAVTGRRLTISFNGPNDDRYEAYDMLIKPTASIRRASSADLKFDRMRAEVEKCFARNMVMGGVATARNVLSVAYDICREVSASYYQLPEDWALGAFTVGQFRQVNDAIRAVLYAWLFITDFAASFDPSYKRDLPFKLKRTELISAVKDVTGISKAVARSIVAFLTYSRVIDPTSDPALQPLVSVAGDDLVLSARLVLGGAPERNMIALINTRPAERAIYDRLKNQKESLMRERLERRRPAYCRSWHGRVDGRKDLPNIDYALFDNRTGTLVLAELKWFVAPDETRELADRGEEIQKGVSQCKKLMAAIANNNSLIRQFVGVKHVCSVVVSANSIGMSYVQDEEIPVINEDHFLEELASAADLAEVADWLRERRYLPERGLDYVSASPIVSFFGWELEWYGFAPLAKEEFLPLSGCGSDRRSSRQAADA